MGNFQSRTMTNIVESESSDDDDFLPASGMETYNNISTDAVETIGFPIKTTKLTMQNVLEIEMELDFNEKVSMVYLLYDDTNLALQYLIKLQNGEFINILHEWVRLAGNIAWQTKLLEALSIIQNYKLLHFYGYSIVEVNQRFLPMNSNTSIEIDITKKKLYRLAEDLQSKQLEKLLNLVKNDFKDKRKFFKTFSGNFLEMYLLYWNSIKYISPSNYTNLATIFKQMEMFEISDYLKLIAEPIERSSSVSSVRHIDVTFLDDVLNIPLNRSMSSASSVNTQDRVRSNSYGSYNMNDSKPGICLIINQYLFYTEPDPSFEDHLPNTEKMLESREGSNFDCARIEKIMTNFGFRVIVEHNIDHQTVMRTLKNTIKQVTEDDSSLFVYIFSHGIQGKIYGNNSVPIEVSEIQKMISHTNVKNLSGKPKALIIQACQGIECQEVNKYEDEEPDIEMDSPQVITRPTPKAADMLVFWATVPGFGAMRDKKKGTWFIQSLCDKLEQHSSKSHLEDICTMVIQDVTNKRWGRKAMVPIKESTLTASLFLPKMRCIF